MKRKVKKAKEQDRRQCYNYCYRFIANNKDDYGNDDDNSSKNNCKKQ